MLTKLWKLAEYTGRFFVTTQRGILIFTSLMLSGVMVTEVVSRYFLGYPIWGWEELAMICAIWLYMIGAAMASYERSHLTTEIVQLVVKDPGKLRIIKALATLITLVMGGYMTYWSSDLFLWGLKQRQTTPVFSIPWVVAQSSLFFAGLLIMIYSLRDLIECIRNILRHGKPYSWRSE